MTTTAILGPGAVGGALAARLDRAGERVVCVARPDSAAAIGAEGLTLVTDTGETTSRVEVGERLDEPVDLLIVAVKAMGLEDGISRIRAEPALVLPLLNGLEHMDVLRARFANVVAATIGHFEGYRATATRIVQQTPGLISVAAAGVPPQLGRAGIDARVGGSEKDVLWEKLARQGPIAVLTSATGQTIGELRSGPLLRLAVEEACAVAAADGAATTVAEQWTIIASLPDWATSSTSRDVAAGRPSELDAIGGAIVRAGSRLGVPTQTLGEALATCPA